MLLTFFGRPRWEPGTHPHESPRIMTGPMVVLAVGSVGAGAALSLGHTLQRWLEPVTGSHEAAHGLPAWVITALALGAVAVGVGVAYRQYATAEVPRVAPQDISIMTAAARSDLYGDAVNEVVFMRGGQQLTKALVVVDDRVIDGSVGALATGVSRVSDALRALQNGFARTYALAMLGGAALAAGGVLIMALWR